MQSSKSLFLFALLALATAARIALNGANVPASDLALRPSYSRDVEIYSKPWTGTTQIEPRRNVLAFLGLATSFLTTAVIGTCTLTAVNPGLVPVCMAGIAVSVFLGALALVGAWASSYKQRDVNELNNLVQFHYPSIAGGQTMLSRLEEAFAFSNDGLPIEMGFTDCVNIEWECQKLWYSISKNASKNGRDIHRIINTPADFDFRAETPTPTKTINVRQAVNSDSATETESGGATPTYYGGYVFEYENDPAETAIAQDDDNSSDAAASVQDIITAMSDQYESDNDKFADMGSYCMDIEEASTSQVGLSGYLWCYDDPSSAPTGGDETSFLGTCAEENG